MGDTVKIIDNCAFFRCSTLRFIRLSNTLEFIGLLAFHHCQYLEAVFLPSTVKSIESGAFDRCRSLRLLILPSDIYLGIIRDTAIEDIAETAGVVYKLADDINYTDESQRQVHNWLKHYMDESPFHKLCYNSSVSTEQINNYLNASDIKKDSALTIDKIHSMTPLHMLAMNPHAPADSLAALLDSNMAAVFCFDKQQNIPLDYARSYNVGGLVGMISALSTRRHAL